MGYNSRLMLSALLGLGTLAGCQNWSALSTGFPIQNPSRVPPPGTGTYPTSSGYYNNSNSTLPTTQAKGPAPTTNASLSGSPVVRASWQADPAPSPVGVNNVASASSKNLIPQSPASAALAPTIKPFAASEFTGASSPTAPAVPSTASLSDATTEPQSQLNWQAPR